MDFTEFALCDKEFFQSIQFARNGLQAPDFFYYRRAYIVPESPFSEQKIMDQDHIAVRKPPFLMEETQDTGKDFVLVPFRKPSFMRTMIIKAYDNVICDRTQVFYAVLVL